MKKLEDYINEQKGNGEVVIVWSYEWYGMMNMVEDLATHIEELEKKMDFVMEEGSRHVMRVVDGKNISSLKWRELYDELYQASNQE